MMREATGRADAIAKLNLLQMLSFASVFSMVIIGSYAVAQDSPAYLVPLPMFIVSPLLGLRALHLGRRRSAIAALIIGTVYAGLFTMLMAIIAVGWFAFGLAGVLDFSIGILSVAILAWTAVVQAREAMRLRACERQQPRLPAAAVRGQH